MDTSAAQTRWEMENNVAQAGPSDVDALYRWDEAEQRAIQSERPWTKDPNHFKQ
jgi:COP9 signalosome complex subunit 5